MNSRDKAKTTTKVGRKSIDQDSSNHNVKTLLKSKSHASETHRPSSSNKNAPSHNRRQTNVDVENKRNKPSSSRQHDLKRQAPEVASNKKINVFKQTSRDSEESRTTSQEMASLHNDDVSSKTVIGNKQFEQETNVDITSTLVVGSQETDDDELTTLLDSQGTSSSSDRSNADGPNLKSITSNDLTPKRTNFNGGMSSLKFPSSSSRNDWDQHLVLYHDDEEINQSSAVQRTSSEEEDFMESGAALTLADESTATAVQNEVINFVVYPLGCCEFDETQLMSSSSTRAIQRSILRLSNNPSQEETMCWGLDRSQPILMRLYENYIQFFDIKSQFLYKSQPINAIKTWAVDDDNNFAFVVEEGRTLNSGIHETDYYDPVEYDLLTGPVFMCYVFNSIDDDDMSCRVAAKLIDEINKYKEQMSDRISKSTRLQQMVDTSQHKSSNITTGEQIDMGDDADDDLDNLVESNEMTLGVKYIGKVQVPRPTGIDVINIAIDKCLANASKAQMNRLLSTASTSIQLDALTMDDDREISPLIEAKLHVSPSSVIVENTSTGEIIVECRIRYLTFMGISRRDIRWCGFIMQNTTNKNFEAHCFECYPTAGHVCEAIQASCSRMYEKMVKSQSRRADDTTSIIPKSSKIRDTLAKTLSKIKLTPIIQ